MRKVICVIILAIFLLVVGCQTGDIKVSPVIEGQRAPHAGYNIGPELYLETGNVVKVTGAVIYIKGFDPNDL